MVFVGGDLGEVPVEGSSGEAPVEGCGGGVVAVLEGQQPVGQDVEVGEVLGLDNFSLHDGEEDLDLVQPGAWIGRCTSSAVGQAVLIRSTDRAPLCEEPLSTTQNTRRALA